MTQAQSEKISHELPDDYWIFEELGSPMKVPSSRLPSSDSSSTSKAVSKNEFEEKLRIYADNMRKLIITARKNIKELKQENTTLKRKLEASGLLECPACLFHFKPERKNRILPKYVKIFRGKLALEVEFSSLDEMSEWLTVNGLDENSDGIPTMLPAEEKVDLTTTGSLLHKLVNEQKESETKQERVVISTRRGLSQSRSSHSSSATPQPSSSNAVGESDDVGKARAADKRRDRMKKNKARERWMSPIFSPESPSTSSADRLCEDPERKVKLPNDQLPFETCTEIINSLKGTLSMEVPDTDGARSDTRKDHRGDSEGLSYARDMSRLKDHLINSLKGTLSMEVPDTDGARSDTRKDHRGDSEGLSYARDMSRLKDHLKQVSDGARNLNGHHGDREEMRSNTQTERRKEVVTSSARHHSSHDSREETGVRRSRKADESLEKRDRLGSLYKRSRVLCHPEEAVNPVKTEKKAMNSSRREIDRNTDNRFFAETSGKENVAHQKESDRGKSSRVDNSRHKRTEEMSKNERHIDVAPLENLSRSSVHCQDSKHDRHGDSQKQVSRRDHVPIKDLVKHDADVKDVRITRSVESTRDRLDRSHRHHAMKKSRDQHHSKRGSPTRRSPLELSHRAEHVHSTRDPSKDHPKEPRRTRTSYKDRGPLSRNERHNDCRGAEKCHKSPRRSDLPLSPTTSAKRRKLSTSSHKSDAQNSVDDEEEALVVSDIDLVVVDEDEVEDGEILD